MPLVYGGVIGNVVKGQSVRNGRREPRRPATRNEQRIHFTFIGMICNILWIQSILPQVLVVPERILGLLDWRTLMNELPLNIYIVRQGSMWVNTDLYAKVLRLLRKCLKWHRVQRHYRVILFADAFGGHITVRSLFKMGDYGFWFVLLPAQLTWLLQPLDVQTFAQMKSFLRNRFASVPENNVNERLILTCLRHVFAAVRKYFVGRSWARAFDSLGLNGAVAPTSKHFFLECEWSQLPTINRGRPTQDIVSLNTPRGRTLHLVALRRCMPPEDTPPAPHAATSEPVISTGLAVASMVPIGEHATRRRVLPPTFFGANFDSDNASE